MPFTFKLSRRLAASHWLVFAAAVLQTSCGSERTLVGPTLDSLPPGRPSVASVTVSPSADSGLVGQILAFQAALADSAGRPLTARVSWSSSDTNVARVDGTGATTLVGPGEADIRATGGGRQGRGRVKVRPVPVDSVAVSPASVNVFQGGTATLVAVTFDSTGGTLSGRPVTWSTSAAGVATVSSAGVVTAVAPGTATITAISEGVAGAASVMVSRVPAAWVGVSPASAGMAVGATTQLTATVRDSAGGVFSGRSVAWSSSATGVATVTSGGLVAGVAAGTATITATSGSATGQATVTVTVVPVASVTVSPATASLTVGGTQQLGATPRDSAGNALTGRSITWASSNGAVATVSTSGLVTAVAAGTATINATSGGASGQATVTVTVAPVASVTVGPASATLAAGASQQLTATPQDAAGNPLAGRTVTWSSSNGAVAAVTAGGLVTAVAAGSATITATSGGVNGTSAITVTAPPSGGLCTPSGSGVCRYVDAASGNDANAGTSGAPYRTLQRAASVVNPGDVVIVRNGRYTGGSTILSIGRSGTAANWITFRAENRWGAVIDGQSFSSTGGINISGRFVRVQGFEILGTSRYGVEAYGGSDVVVAQNHIHDIGHICTSSSGGIVGINAYVPNLLIEQNLVHDIGRLADGQNGCTTTNTYWQNHDHGIYQGEGDNLVVRNNVFYNLQHGWAFQRYNGGGITVTSLQIVNNTFAGANPWRDGQIVIATGATGLVIANNLFYQPRGAAVFFDNPGLVVGSLSNNLTYGAGLTTGSTLGMVIAGNLSGDPRFVDAAGFDFHLQSGSPALGAGLVLSLITNDFDGTLRLAGVAPDLGAFER